MGLQREINLAWRVISVTNYRALLNDRNSHTVHLQQSVKRMCRELWTANKARSLFHESIEAPWETRKTVPESHIYSHGFGGEEATVEIFRQRYCSGTTAKAVQGSCVKKRSHNKKYVDPEILPDRLETFVGLSSPVFSWFNQTLEAGSVLFVWPWIWSDWSDKKGVGWVCSSPSDLQATRLFPEQSYHNGAQSQTPLSLYKFQMSLFTFLFKNKATLNIYLFILQHTTNEQRYNALMPYDTYF